MKCLNRTLMFILVVFSAVTLWIQLKILFVREETDSVADLFHDNNSTYEKELPVHSDFLTDRGVRNRTSVLYKGNESLAKGHDKDELLSDESGDSGYDFGDLELPGTYTYLPHLKGHPEYLKPVFRITRNRTGVTLVIGIPTIKRENVTYLHETLKSLFSSMSHADAAKCLIILFIAEPWDTLYQKRISLSIQLNYPTELSSGLLEVMAPPSKYYPNLDTLPLTLNDDRERVKWRTKQNLDYAFLMLHASKRGQYYIQLEDDIITRQGFFSTIMLNADRRTEWTVIRFSALGFIGKLIKTSDLPILIEFLYMFHGDKPGDWLLENLLTTKVCSKDMLPKECQQAVSKITIDVKPALFQHIGLQSSLKGKIQKLKEKSFKTARPPKSSMVWLKKDVSGGVNPPAKYILTTIDQFENFSIEGVYTGESAFWGYTPYYGDTIDISYEPPIKIHSYKIVSGSKDHPTDIFPPSTTVLVLTDSPDVNSTQLDSYFLLGNFNEKGIAQGQVSVDMNNVKTFRIRVQEEMKTWIFLKEIFIGVNQTNILQ